MVFKVHANESNSTIDQLADYVVVESQGWITRQAVMQQFRIELKTQFG